MINADAGLPRLGNNQLIYHLDEPLKWDPYSEIGAVYSDEKPHTLLLLLPPVS